MHIFTWKYIQFIFEAFKKKDTCYKGIFIFCEIAILCDFCINTGCVQIWLILMQPFFLCWNGTCNAYKSNLASKVFIFHGPLHPLNTFATCPLILYSWLCKNYHELPNRFSNPDFISFAIFHLVAVIWRN